MTTKTKIILGLLIAAVAVWYWRKKSIAAAASTVNQDAQTAAIPPMATSLPVDEGLAGGASPFSGGSVTNAVNITLPL